jgi:hypothetical protein
MKKILLLFLTVFFIKCSYGQNEKDLVRQTYENYKSSILENRGADASELVSVRTLEYYDNMILHAISSDSITIANLPFYDAFSVLVMRHYLLKEELLKMDSKTFFIYIIENDFFEKEKIIDTKVGDVKINRNFALGKMILKDQELPLFLNFYKENDLWKFDLVSQIKTSTSYFTDYFKSSELTVNEFINEALFRLNGKEPSPSIWNPTK